LIEWKLVWEFFPKILKGLPTTLQFVFLSAAIGIFIGLLLAIVRVERVPVLRQLSAFFISYIRGTPLFIQLFIVYYGFPFLLYKTTGINIIRADKMLFVYITYSMSIGAYFSETFRAAINSVAKAQSDAAFSVGHTKLTAYTRIILPQAAVIALPNIGMSLVMLLQNSTLTVALGVMDIMGITKLMAAKDMGIGQVEAYVAAGIIFVILSILIARVFGFIEKKIRIHGIEYGSRDQEFRLINIT
jgi:L-cystine transport system permease protein